MLHQIGHYLVEVGLDILDAAVDTHSYTGPDFDVGRRLDDVFELVFGWGVGWVLGLLRHLERGEENNTRRR